MTGIRGQEYRQLAQKLYIFPRLANNTGMSIDDRIVYYAGLCVKGRRFKCAAAKSVFPMTVACVFGVDFLCSNVLMVPSARLYGDIACTLLYALILPPLALGVRRYFHLCSLDREDGLSSVFYYLGGFRPWFLAVRFQLVLLVKRLFYFALFSIPAAAVLGLTIFFCTVAENDTDFWLCLFGLILSALLFALTWVYFCFFNTRYFLAAAFFFQDEKAGVFPAVKQSVQGMRGFMGQLFFIRLCNLRYLILYIFILPYFYFSPQNGLHLALLARYMAEFARRGEQG